MTANALNYLFLKCFHDFLSDLTDSIEFGPHPLKIIRQCLRQLDLLKNVWQTILPELVYNKTMGTIVNDFCDEIVKKVMLCEDISSDVANGMVDICDTIIERIPAILTVRKYLSKTIEENMLNKN